LNLLESTCAIVLSIKPLRLEIRHRFFARLGVAATVDRTRIVHNSDRPDPIAAGWRLRRQEYAPDVERTKGVLEDAIALALTDIKGFTISRIDESVDILF
jgi:hypothetical protein